MNRSRVAFPVAVWFVALGCTQPNTVQSANQSAQATSPQPPAEPQERRGRTMVDAKPVPLNELVQKADRIFVGTVKDVQVKTEALSEQGRTANAQVRDVTIAVSDGIKNVKTGDTIVVRQLLAVSAPLNAGEDVLWFLATPSALGLTQPLGVFSGDFRIESTPEGNRMVQNLRGNDGLWANSVWDEGFNRNQVMAQAKVSKLPAVTIQALDKAAVTDPAEQAVPLELLLLLTRSAIKQ